MFTVIPPPPTCMLKADPSTITQGQSSTLTWTTANSPATASIDNGVGSVNTAGGNTNISPTATTTYTLTVQNTGGTGMCSANVTVNPSVSPVPTSMQTARGWMGGALMNNTIYTV